MEEIELQTPTPEAPASLREQIEQNVTATEEPEPEKPGRTAGRARDEQGRLLPGKSAATPAPPPIAAGTEPPSAVPAVAAPEVKHISHPSTWKKEHWDGFSKIATENPGLAEYINQRESEYSRGVSTYKAEAENAKQLHEALAPFMGSLQQNNVNPAQFISNLGNAHMRLTYGSPQEKVHLGAQLIREYGINPQELFQVLSNPNSQAPQLNSVDVSRTVDTQIQQALMKREIETAYKTFTEEKDEQGNLKHPHFEAVKTTMAGLLQAGLAQDYPSAYEAALRHPSHNDIFAAMQEQQRQTEENHQKELAKQQVLRARSQAISPKSATPGPAVKVNGTKSLRDTLSSAVEEHAGGRI